MNFFHYIGAKIHNKISEGVIPTEEQLKNAKRYKHVVILGIDGAGDYFQYCNMPNYEKIYKNGAVSYVSQAQYPTASGQNWTSALHGVCLPKHRVDNEVCARNNFTDERLPSVFRVYGERHPDKNMVSIVNWYPVNKGIVENLPNVKKINGDEVNKSNDSTDKVVDPIICEEAVAYVKDKANEPSIMYTHFDYPDSAGHEKGYGSPYYKECIEKCDEFIGKIYDTYVENGWGDDTLFITMSDHGHTKKGGHGNWGKTERSLTIAVWGGQGDIIKGHFGKASTPDVASIVLYALGEKQPKIYDGRVPYGIFNTLPLKGE